MLERLKAGIWDFLHRIGPNRYEYLMRTKPKGDPTATAKWLLDSEHGVLTFPHAPCPWLCQRGFRRFHFTCLTCWTRRLHFKKRGWKKLKWYRNAVMMNKPPIGYKGAIPVQPIGITKLGVVGLPIYYTNYGIFVPTTLDGNPNRIKLFLVKYLLTLAERIAEF